MKMRRVVYWTALAVFLSGTSLAACGSAAPAEQPDTAGPTQKPMAHWSTATLTQLRGWLALTPGHALPVPATDALDAAERAGDAVAMDREATAVALCLARSIALGWMRGEARGGWHVVDSDARLDLESGLASAVQAGTVDAFLTSLLPDHPAYAALHAAYATERDATRHAAMARNMERWRWMPRTLGHEYLLVNTAAFRVDLWRGNVAVRSWRVVVGKVATPTPVFDATVTGLQVNPWWDIPANIVAESVGALARRNPALAHRRGYDWSGGHYRQRPGPANALGQMKLVMPNPFNVYLHDTPSKSLFARDARAFSHGCVRVDDALGLAETLLAPQVPRTRIDALVASGANTTLRLAQPVPVYVTYFTAEPGADGSIAILPDIYARDGAMGDADKPHPRCAA